MYSCMMVKCLNKGGNWILEERKNSVEEGAELQPCAEFARGPWSLDEEPVLCENCALPEAGKCPRGADAASVPGRNV